MQTIPNPEDWLPFFMWSLDLFLNPKPSLWLESYESWYYRNYWWPALRALRRRGLVQVKDDRGRRLYGLTDTGRVAACGGVDPEARWRRSWDGQWRLLVFDLHVEEHALRVRLWRWLQRHRFGYLQKSVWLSPDPVDLAAMPLPAQSQATRRLVAVVGQPHPGFAASDLIHGAWDFGRINQGYERYLDLLQKGEHLLETAPLTPGTVRRWLVQEQQAWQAAVDRDPLLPAPLLPADYRGRQAYERRLAVLRRWTTVVGGDRK